MNQHPDSGSAIAAAILESAVAAPEADLLELRVGPYWTAVQTSVGSGIASTLRAESYLHGSIPIAGAGALHRSTPLELAGLLASSSQPEAAVGLAAVNALLCGVPRDFDDANAKLALFERCEGRVAAIVGHFPFVDDLRSRCRELFVFERGQGKRPDDLGPEHVQELLPKAEIVAISATTLINHTLEEILPFIRPDGFSMMLGPSTPMTPCLFDLGFDVLCGTLVEDADAVLRAVEQGAVTCQIGGVRRVCLWRDGSY
jgi:uncharacterized protein (DUF4213/DUF364 family)